MIDDDQLLQLLAPDAHAPLYAVLDGARDRRIHRLVAESELPWSCLYAGSLPAEIREVAPYLARMQSGSVLARQTVAAGWGCAWGIWLISAAPFDQLRRHLRRFLRVKAPDGQRLLFRYYDPRVLECFLPTCTEVELAELFGPIDMFLIEDRASPSVTELRFDGFTLQLRTRTLAERHQIQV